MDFPIVPLDFTGRGDLQKHWCDECWCALFVRQFKWQQTLGTQGSPTRRVDGVYFLIFSFQLPMWAKKNFAILLRTLSKLPSHVKASALCYGIFRDVTFVCFTLKHSSSPSKKILHNWRGIHQKPGSWIRHLNNHFSDEEGTFNAQVIQQFAIPGFLVVKLTTRTRRSSGEKPKSII